MKSTPFRSRTALIMPLVLLVVALLEDVATYKIRQHVRGVHWRAGILLLLTGVGFAFAGGYVAPWLKVLFTTVRKHSRSGGGKPGIWLFYALAYGALFYAYVVIERSGIGGLLPASWR
jgi:hypothetical protein